jgi:peptidoglycan/LPS O-acetylase OafA/YrhL
MSPLKQNAKVKNNAMSGPPATNKCEGLKAFKESTPPPDKRLLGLDVLRFIAISLVVFRHLEGLECSPEASSWCVWVQKIADTLNCGGWVGVDIFFVLSGFLVSGLLFREWHQRKEISLGRFLVRRGLKIYPAFWFFLFSMLVLSIIQHRPIDKRGLLGEFLFLQNCWANLFNHTWSLAVEEHFYLLCAVGAWLLLRMRRTTGENPFKSIPFLFMLVAAICLVTRLVSNHLFPPGRVRLLFFGTHIRVDSLFFGVLLSYLWHFYFTAKHHRVIYQFRWVLVFVGIGLLAPMFSAQPFDPRQTWIRVYGFVLCYLAGGALLLGTLKIFEGAISPLARLVGFLGANSYSVYLWHQLGISLAAMMLAQHTRTASAWIAYCLLSHGMAWGTGIVAGRIVEVPVLKLRDRWFPSKTTRSLKN